MTLQPILIDGAWEQASAVDGSFHAMNPSTKEATPFEYPVLGLADVERMIGAAQQAVAELRAVSPEQIAQFLETFADNIEARKDALVEMAQQETALGKEPRLGSVELPRTSNQLRQAAAAARDRSWCMATIDTASNIRAKFGPLGGPVVVFGPNNFPYAFNSAVGGDFAAAIAAGNPVIAKANTSHPQTTKLLAEAAFDAVQSTGMPRAMVQLLYRTKPDVGLKLVSHPQIGATGFTGSKNAGLKLKAAADAGGKPIYLEMSSVNPIFVLPGALAERSQALAEDLVASCTLGTGQFCTNPGIVVLLDDAASAEFTQKLAELMQAKPNGTLLGAGGPDGIAHALKVWQEHGAELVVGGEPVDGPGYSFSNTLMRVAGADFLANPEALQEEAFGVASLLVFAESAEQMRQIAASVEGQLTGCLYTHSQGLDDEMYDLIEPVLRQKVGRLLNDKMPTGVAVVSSMNHGGPYPATGHPGFTAVGIPASMLRFAALHCYDNVRAHRLPTELQDKNPTGNMWRLIDRVWSKGDV
ncbi:MAG: aldehyde dehydrogenase (NADP(+)) [Caldilineaceae bacterium]